MRKNNGVKNVKVNFQYYNVINIWQLVINRKQRLLPSHLPKCIAQKTNPVRLDRMWKTQELNTRKQEKKQCDIHNSQKMS